MQIKKIIELIKRQKSVPQLGFVHDCEQQYTHQKYAHIAN